MSSADLLRCRQRTPAFLPGIEHTFTGQAAKPANRNKPRPLGVRATVFVPVARRLLLRYLPTEQSTIFVEQLSRLRIGTEAQSIDSALATAANLLHPSGELLAPSR